MIGKPADPVDLSHSEVVAAHRHLSPLAAPRLASAREQLHLRLALESQSQTRNLRGRSPGNPGRVGYGLQDDRSCRNETLWSWQFE